MGLARRLLLMTDGLLVVVTCYLLALLGAAASARRPRGISRSDTEPLRFLVLIPAHNEELDIGSTLASLERLEYPKDRFELVVVADNCHDRTAEIARAAGATVYERTDTLLRGKGQALAWVLKQLARDRPEFDAIAVVDADCQVSSNLLVEMEHAMRGGARAVQANYVVANPGQSWSSGLRYAAFSLINTVHPLGKGRFGLSTGLLGTGMGFVRSLLDEYPWDAFSVIEDGEYHSRLVLGGERVVFLADASVNSVMPTSFRGARQQQLRWESGRWALVRTYTIPLLRVGLRRRDLIALHAAVERLVPPQSLLVAVHLTTLFFSVALRSRLAMAMSVMNVFGQVTYVVGGLKVAGAPGVVYRALAMAPVLIVWKLGLYARVLAGHGATEWVRTPRAPGVSGRGESTK